MYFDILGLYIHTQTQHKGLLFQSLKLCLTYLHDCPIAMTNMELGQAT